jgi:hypothetical protein
VEPVRPGGRWELRVAYGAVVLGALLSVHAVVGRDDVARPELYVGLVLVALAVGYLRGDAIRTRAAAEGQAAQTSRSSVAGYLIALAPTAIGVGFVVTDPGAVLESSYLLLTTLAAWVALSVLWGWRKAQHPVELPKGARVLWGIVPGLLLAVYALTAPGTVNTGECTTRRGTSDNCYQGPIILIAPAVILTLFGIGFGSIDAKPKDGDGPQTF